MKKVMDQKKNNQIVSVLIAVSMVLTIGTPWSWGGIRPYNPQDYSENAAALTEPGSNSDTMNDVSKNLPGDRLATADNEVLFDSSGKVQPKPPAKTETKEYDDDEDGVSDRWVTIRTQGDVQTEIEEFDDDGDGNPDRFVTSQRKGRDGQWEVISEGEYDQPGKPPTTTETKEYDDDGDGVPDRWVTIRTQGDVQIQIEEFDEDADGKPDRFVTSRRQGRDGQWEVISEGEYRRPDRPFPPDPYPEPETRELESLTVARLQALFPDNDIDDADIEEWSLESSSAGLAKATFKFMGIEFEAEFRFLRGQEGGWEIRSLEGSVSIGNDGTLKVTLDGVSAGDMEYEDVELVYGNSCSKEAGTDIWACTELAIGTPAGKELIGIYMVEQVMQGRGTRGREVWVFGKPMGHTPPITPPSVDPDIQEVRELILEDLEKRLGLDLSAPGAKDLVKVEYDEELQTAVVQIDPKLKLRKLENGEVTLIDPDGEGFIPNRILYKFNVEIARCGEDGESLVRCIGAEPVYRLDFGVFQRKNEIYVMDYIQDMNHQDQLVTILDTIKIYHPDALPGFGIGDQRRLIKAIGDPELKPSIRTIAFEYDEQDRVAGGLIVNHRTDGPYVSRRFVFEELDPADPRRFLSEWIDYDENTNQIEKTEFLYEVPVYANCASNLLTATANCIGVPAMLNLSMIKRYGANHEPLSTIIPHPLAFFRTGVSGGIDAGVEILREIGVELGAGADELMEELEQAVQDLEMANQTVPGALGQSRRSTDLRTMEILSRGLIIVHLTGQTELMKYETIWELIRRAIQLEGRKPTPDPDPKPDPELPIDFFEEVERRARKVIAEYLGIDESDLAEVTLIPDDGLVDGEYSVDVRVVTVDDRRYEGRLTGSFDDQMLPDLHVVYLEEIVDPDPRPSPPITAVRDWIMNDLKESFGLYLDDADMENAVQIEMFSEGEAHVILDSRLLSRELGDGEMTLADPFGDGTLPSEIHFTFEVLYADCAEAVDGQTDCLGVPPIYDIREGHFQKGGNEYRLRYSDQKLAAVELSLIAPMIFVGDEEEHWEERGGEEYWVDGEYPNGRLGAPDRFSMGLVGHEEMEGFEVDVRVETFTDSELMVEHYGTESIHLDLSVEYRRDEVGRVVGGTVYGEGWEIPFNRREFELMDENNVTGRKFIESLADYDGDGNLTAKSVFNYGIAHPLCEPGTDCGPFQEIVDLSEITRTGPDEEHLSTVYPYY